jgi:beta-galactosidase
MQLGVCYYPEHWPEKTWQPDAARMQEIGLGWVRIGEFAWSRLEPKPGKLTFDWLDRAMDTLGNAGLKVMLGTPTATPPKWLIDKYDDVLQVDEQGRVRKFGSRRHYCFNSASYREETTRIVTLLAERYSQHEALGAWQTDNEYGCHGTIRCYCSNCEKAFQNWLKDRYENINVLNDAWWNIFWSMEYRGFEEIELPNLTVTEANPSHNLDFYRFSSDSAVAYNRLQADILRAHSDKPVTHNVMLYFGDLNAFDLAGDLDILTWDSYPLGMLEQSPLPAEVKARYLRCGHPDLISFMHDLYYGAKAKPFWVIEQQPGQVNWAPSNPIPAPGVVRLWTHQAFGHGADVVSYFRWRAAVGAQELMHAGLNRHDGSPDQATSEARRVARELAELDLPLGTEVDADVALLFDYDSLWATNLQRHAEGWDYWALLVSYYGVLRSFGLNVHVIPARNDLATYRVVFAPALHLVDDALATRLKTYVSGGGTLIMGPRSGFKTMSNTAHTPAPGPLAELMGVTISRVDALRPGITETITFGDYQLTYHTWADVLEPTHATALSHYECHAYPEAAAVTRNDVENGRCYTLGMWGDDLTHAALFQYILSELLELKLLPEGVRLVKRGNITTLLNFNSTPVTLEVTASPVTLEPYGAHRHQDSPKNF